MAGTISTYEVVRLDANSITANISHNPGADAAAPALAWLEASSSITGNITSYRGNIGTVRVAVGGSGGLLAGFLTTNWGNIGSVTVAGNISAGITAGTSALQPGSITSITGTGNMTGNTAAPYGTIGTINITGDIGTSTSLRSIQAKNGIASVAGNRVYANIVANLNASTGLGDLGHVVTRATSGGHFVGSATARAFSTVPSDLAPAFAVLGDLDADLTAIAFDRGIEVGGALKAGRTITIAANANAGLAPFTFGSLQGQIIFNACDGCYPSATQWTNPTTIGSIQLTTANGQIPFYTYTSAELGGGAIGQARFHLHDQDCDPPNGGSHAFQSKTTVFLEFYGPISWNPASGCPVQVDWRTAGASTWTALPSTDFSAETVPDHPRQMAVLAVTAFDYDDQMDYRIRPVDNIPITCVGVGNGTIPVSSFAYIIHGQ